MYVCSACLMGSVCTWEPRQEILEMGIDENAPDVRLAQPKSAMNLFSLDTCYLTRRVTKIQPNALGYFSRS